MKYELVIVWDTGEKEIHEYNTQEEAEIMAQGDRTAFGNQISWTGIRRTICWLLKGS